MTNIVYRSFDWRMKLAEYLHVVASRHFSWGEHDCALFAAGAIKAMTGHDFAAEFRGRYATSIGGLRILRKAGFADHAELAASIFEEVAPAFAHVGDIAVIDTDQGAALGIIQGSRVYVLRPDEAGIGTVDLLTASRAFRVPFSPVI